MSKGTVIFTYNGNEIIIQCLTNDKFSKICENCLTKSLLDKSKTYYYLYNGNIINQKLSFEEQINIQDKKENKMYLIVIDENKNKENKNNIIESEEIIAQNVKRIYL